MVIRSKINASLIKDTLIWDLKWTLNQLNIAAGYSNGYIYKLLDDEREADITLGTVDSLHDAVVERFKELGMNPPSDLWCNLVVREEVSDQGKEEPLVDQNLNEVFAGTDALVLA